MESNEENEIILINKSLKDMPKIESHVTKLDIRRNKLTLLSFPDNSALKYIDVSDNLLETLESVSGLKKLESLDFGYNLIQRITELDLPALKEFYVMSNDIKEIENINFPNLIKIDMANNEISVLKQFNCPNIEEAYFGANKITKIEDMSIYSNLRILDLQCNAITELDCNLLPQSIETLLLNNCTDLEKIRNLENLKSLKLLGIKNTKIIGLELPESIEIW